MLGRQSPILALVGLLTPLLVCWQVSVKVVSVLDIDDGLGERREVQI
jgi:hypothetical protein